MVKKVLSFLSVFALLLTIVPMTAFAVDNDAGVNIDLVNNAAFNPSAGQQLTINVNYADNMGNSHGYVKIKQADTTIQTITSWGNQEVANADAEAAPAGPFTWNGLAGCPNGVVCANGNNYIVEVFVSYTENNIEQTDTDTGVVTIVGGLEITALTAVPTDGGTFDPAQDGEDEDLIITYALNKAPTAVNVKVKNSRNVEMKNFDGQLQNSQFSWDGVFANEIVEPGVYSVIFTATKAGEATVTRTIEVTVRYDSADKAQITGLKADPESFDPDNGDTTITFRNDERADITLEIQNADGVALKTFDDFRDEDIIANTDNEVTWNGERNDGDVLGNGTYKVVVIARNDFGVTVATSDVKIDDTGEALPKSNAHISNISCTPGSTFEPAEDEELACEADTEKDDIDLQVFAVKGALEIELFDDEGIDEGNDSIEFTWDGRDEDDEYVDEGSWRIEFRSTDSDNRELLAGVTRKIEYAKPRIDEFFLSKDKIDNDIGEITYAIFRLEDDGEVSLNYLLDGEDDDEIEEELEVEADRWYAVEVDADGYDYEDDIDVQLVAANTANIDVNEKRRDSLDLAEEKESSSKANITNDFIYPVVTDCNEDLEINYTLEDPGSVEISIHKGKTTGGSKVTELINLENQEDGDHSLTWNCRDDNNDKLSDGFYTYKIVSRDSSTDTESGIFVVGDVGDGGSSSSDDNDSNDNGSSNPNVVIKNGDDNNDDEEPVPDEPQPPSNDDCAGFSDLDENYEYCEAVEWAKDSGVLQGYPDGTFRASSPINRVELLKVVLNALDVNTSGSVEGNLGFNDVIVNSWYMPFIKKGKELGVFVGDAGRATARPGDFINRAETLKIVFETLRTAGGYNLGNIGSTYNDVKNSDWFYRYVGESARYDLFDDISGNNFLPAAFTTRGEVVELLFRLHEEGLI